MHELFQTPVAGGVAHIAHTTRLDGDLSPANVEHGRLVTRRRGLINNRWFSCRQVHSDRVVRIDAGVDREPSLPDAPRNETPVGDALVTDRTGVVLAVHSGDCVPVGFVHPSGLIAVAHAGWRGLAAGILESTARTIRSELIRPEVDEPIEPIVAVVGPHIRASHYEFGAGELRSLSDRFDTTIEATTIEGTPALDLTAVVEAELGRLGVGVVGASDDCTAADADHYWSHRARGEAGRFALVAWIEER